MRGLSNMLILIKKFFHIQFKPTKHTAVAFALGIAILILSFCLTSFKGTEMNNQLMFSFIRDILMIFIVGFIFPLCYVLFIKNTTLKDFGITSNKWKLSLVINIVFAVMLFIGSLNEPEIAGRSITLTNENLGQLFYYLFIGIFEMTIFYGFLRQQFEEAFGIIPALILASIFYSLHHVSLVESGNYFELLFVGLMFGTIYYITRNILIIFPFFWFIGACKEIIFGIEAPIGRLNARGNWSRALILLALFLFASYIIISIYKRYHSNKYFSNNCNS